MKVSKIKSEPRVEIRDDSTFMVHNWGLRNDYPTKLREICASSGTASNCLKTKMRFLEGGGFKDETFYKANDKLLHKITIDASYYSGFAIWVGINALMQQSGEYKHVNFEFCRLTTEYRNPDIKTVEWGNYEGIAVYNDWGRRTRASMDRSKIKYFPRWKNDLEYIKESVDQYGGILNHPGFIYWVSAEGENCYPVANYDCVITDINSEDGFSTVRNRQVKKGFMPESIFCWIGNEKYRRSLNISQEEMALLNPIERDEILAYNNFKQDLGDSLEGIQGDESSSKIIEFMVDSKEEIPTILQWEKPDFHKLFAGAEETAQENIGKAFAQPPILRNEMIAGKLGSSAEIQEAFYLYNSILDPDRRLIEREFQELYSANPNLATINPTNDFSIIPLQYLGSQQPKQPAV